MTKAARTPEQLHVLWTTPDLRTVPGSGYQKSQAAECTFQQKAVITRTYFLQGKFHKNKKSTYLGGLKPSWRAQRQAVSVDRRNVNKNLKNGVGKRVLMES